MSPNHTSFMNDTGLEVIRSASPSLPYVMRPADLRDLGEEAQRIWSLETRADDFYALCTENRRPARMDYTEKLIRL